MPTIFESLIGRTIVQVSASCTDPHLHQFIDYEDVGAEVADELVITLDDGRTIRVVPEGCETRGLSARVIMAGHPALII